MSEKALSLNESTKVSIGFIVTFIVPLTVWLAGLSYMVAQTREELKNLSQKIEQKNQFEREVIDRLARIEEKLQKEQAYISEKRR